jgi:hypothetical protein
MSELNNNPDDLSVEYVAYWTLEQQGYATYPLVAKMQLLESLGIEEVTDDAVAS